MSSLPGAVGVSPQNRSSCEWRTGRRSRQRHSTCKGLEARQAQRSCGTEASRAAEAPGLGERATGLVWGAESGLKRALWTHSPVVPSLGIMSLSGSRDRSKLWYLSPAQCDTHTLELPACAWSPWVSMCSQDGRRKNLQNPLLRRPRSRTSKAELQDTLSYLASIY